MERGKLSKNILFSIRIVFILTGLFFSSISWSKSTNLGFSVQVRIELKTCDVNDNKEIEVNFGDMIIKNIDGLNYEQTIPYTLKCDGAESNTKLKLRFENNSGTKFNSKLLKTSEPNLGLKIKRNGQDLSINDWVIFDYENKPLLTVVPITNSSGGLNEGEFDATALLTVEYE